MAYKDKSINKLFGTVRGRINFYIWYIRYYISYIFFYGALRKNPLFDLREVKKGFANRINDNYDNEDNILRICNAYIKAKEDQKKKSSEFQVGGEWLPIYERYMGSIMKALSEKDIAGVMKIYKNFLREDCSNGLRGLSFDMEKTFFSGNIWHLNKKIYLVDFLHRVDLWERLIGEGHNINELIVPDIGNPFGLYINGVFIRSGTDYQHYYATSIIRLIKYDNNERRVVLEIGAGFGGMAYYLCRNEKNLTFIDVDLPENMALTAYYLTSLFPQKKIMLYGEAPLNEKTINSFDIIILPNFCIEDVPDNSCALTFNSYSLAEMPKATVDLYIKHIARMTSRYFLHLNHTKYGCVKADDFGIDPDKFNLLHKRPGLWNWGRNRKMDEYEYLYEKCGSS